MQILYSFVEILHSVKLFTLNFDVNQIMYSFFTRQNANVYMFWYV